MQHGNSWVLLIIGPIFFLRIFKPIKLDNWPLSQFGNGIVKKVSQGIYIRENKFSNSSEILETRIII